MPSLLEELRNGLKAAARRPVMWQYKPYEGVQENFHKNTKRGRVMLGGNRAGKTVSGAMESCWYLTGTHPYRKTPEPPVYGRGVAVDIEQGLNKIMLPEIKKWMPAFYLIDGSWDASYSKQSRTLTLVNGSQMDFLTYDQDIDKHAGTSRNFCWWDEEPPQSIFNEDSLRLVDVNGHWWMTLTPLLGFTWIYHQYYRPVVEQGQEDKTVAVFVAPTEGNPHVSVEVLDEILKGMSAEEKEARKHGKFMASSGLVYPQFNTIAHVVPPIDHNKITEPIVCAMDHGLRHPTVWLWAYVDHEGVIVVFKEYYEADRTIEQHSAAVRKLESEGRNPIGPRVLYRIGDPSIEQRSAATGTSVRTLYAEQDFFIGLANNDMDAGLNKVRAYLEHFGLRITESCPNLIRELMSYRWDTYANRKANDTKKSKDAPRKVNDDACDTLRYLVMSRPDDEFEGWAGEFRAPFLNAAMAAPDVPDGEYSYEDLKVFDEDSFHQILGEDW